jgi:hypothetical protein
MKIILSEEFRRMQKLAGITSEMKFTNPDKIDPETKIAKELANISGDFLDSQFEFMSYIRDYYNNPDDYDIDTDSEYYQAIEYAYENPQQGWELYQSQFEDNLDEVKFTQGDKPMPNIKILKNLYFFPDEGLASLDTVSFNYVGEPELAFEKGTILKHNPEEQDSNYNLVVNSELIKKDVDYTNV